MNIKQGLILTANKTFGIKPPDSNRVRTIKEGAEFWVCSTITETQAGIVRIAPKNKNVGYSIAFQIKDIEENFRNNKNEL